MNSSPRWLGRSSVVALVLLTSWSSFAEESPTGTNETPAALSEGASTPSSGSAPVAPVPPAAPVPSQPQAQSNLGPVFVSVDSVGYSVSPEAIATAIVRELEVARTSSPSTARGTFIVRVTAGKDLVVTFRGMDGSELQRVVKAPANEAQLSEVAALLAVNLAQDRSAEMLDHLKPPASVAETSPPPPTPRATPGAPAATDTSQLPAPPKLKRADANASFFYPLTIVRDSDEHLIAVEFGLLYSKLGALDGFGLNPVLLHVRHSTSGLLIGGVGTIAGSPDFATSHDVVRLGGVFNYGHGPLNGVSISGAVDLELISEGSSHGLSGVQVAGLASVVTGSAEGAQLSGAVNYARNVVGLQVASAANIAHGQLNGIQVGGATSVVMGRVDGAQISGAANVARGHLQGAQFSGAVNVAQDVSGLQVGLVNIGKRVSGAQIGLVNIAEEVDGASVGLVTYSEKGQTQVSIWSDPTRPLNVGVRFVSGPLYAMPMVGADPTQSEAFDFGFSLGARIPVRRFYFDIEGNASNQFRDSSVDESRIDLRYRAAVGYEVLPWLGVFAGGGVRHEFHAKDGGPHELTPVWNIGVDLL